ncbi:VOC family protein [Thermodesulfobacteriota bacterium]
MKYQFHHIHLLCRDLEQMILFFTATLGANLVERKKFDTADGATLNLHDTIINLRIDREDETVLPDTSLTHYGYNHIGLTVEDIEKSYSELTRKGYDFFGPPKEVGKNKVAFFSGPENITIELLQPIE